MSPSWRERLVIGLTPGAVQIARYSRGLRPRLVESAMLPCESSNGEPWRPALDALARELPRRAAARPVSEVVLSNHFVRYQLLPWRPELRSRRERAAVAQAQYRAIFGDASRQWLVRLAEAAFGAPTLACAVDSALVEKLRQLFDSTGARRVSVQPYLAAAVNAWRRKLSGAAYWFALIEPGRLLLGRAERDAWTTISARSLGDCPLAETLAGLTQEAAASGDAIRPTTYCVVSGFGHDRLRMMDKAGLHVLAAEPDAALCLGGKPALH